MSVGASSNPAVPTSSERRLHRSALIVALLFFVTLALVIPEPARFRGDERYYTDAAIHMVQSGDYLTPVYPDGSIRLRKPILTYWAVAGSFEVFGITLFAARLPSLLAGMLVVYFTWHMARTVFQCERIALLAACVMASDIELMNLSTRSTPDALACLFVTVSMWGFARVWFGQDRTLAGPLLAFGGIGMAAQTKGFVGLGPLAANALFWLAARPKSASIKHVLRLPALVLGLSLGLSWYAMVILKHGPSALGDFYSDQVSGKVSYHPVNFLASFFKYLFAGFRQLLPWTVLLLVGLLRSRRQVIEFCRRYRNECLFLAALFAVLLAFFSLGNMWRARFLITSHPTLAVLLAGCLSSVVTSAAFMQAIRIVLTAVAGVLLLAGVGLLIAAAGPEWRFLIAGAALVVLAMWGVLRARRSRELTGFIWLTVVTLAAFSVYNASLRPVLSPSPLVRMTELLQQTHPRNAPVYVYAISEADEGQLRVLLRGDTTVRRVPKTPEPPDLSEIETAIVFGTNSMLFAQAGYELFGVSTGNTAPSSSWLGRLGPSRSAAGAQYWIAAKHR